MRPYDVLVAFQLRWQRTWWWRHGRTAVRPYGAMRRDIAPTGARASSSAQRANTWVVRDVGDVSAVLATHEVGEPRAHCHAPLRGHAPAHRPHGSAGVRVRTTTEHMCRAHAPGLFLRAFGPHAPAWLPHSKNAMRPYDVLVAFQLRQRT
ncbi:hypothetical protein HRbin30_00595 [bacterium HR30]|nr:hypothetical protein HRbin30_00595 [bacterium HR30]